MYYLACVYYILYIHQFKFKTQKRTIRRLLLISIIIHVAHDYTSITFKISEDKHILISVQ